MSTSQVQSPCIPEEALARLRDGNERFVSGAMRHDHQSEARRLITAAEGQHPYACVLGCSDSRVPVELLFDCGIGDVFVIRVAGNVAGPSKTAASVEFAVTQLGVPLAVVLGHTGCGAVRAALDVSAGSRSVSAQLRALIGAIEPACVEARAGAHDPTSEDGLVDAAVEANVRRQLAMLRGLSPAVSSGEEAGSVLAIGAVYDMASGRVRWL
ncbi:MAG: carbonic anhydrase [Phycisphaerales bacterium JB040]